jgi:hypothetical protein
VTGDRVIAGAATAVLCLVAGSAVSTARGESPAGFPEKPGPAGGAVGSVRSGAQRFPDRAQVLTA